MKKEYYLKNKEKIRARCRAYYLKNRHRILVRSKARYHEDPQKNIPLQKIWRQKNKARLRVSRQKWQRKNADRIKEYGKADNLKRHYGLTINDWNEIARSQNGLCAVCGIRGATSVDHCHNSGKLRGLVCRSCNSGLGNFRDDINILRGAIKYLERARIE